MRRPESELETTRVLRDLLLRIDLVVEIRIGCSVADFGDRAIQEQIPFGSVELAVCYPSKGSAVVLCLKGGRLHEGDIPLTKPTVL